MNRTALMAGALVIGVAPLAAWAQAIPAGESVADRPRPDYDPIGDRVGTFTLFPSVTASASATNNYLATDTDVRGDVYFDIRPQLEVRRTGPRTSFDSTVFADQSEHVNLGTENTTQYGVIATETYEPMRDTQLRLDGTVAHFVESRASLGAFQGSVNPVEYEQYGGDLSLAHTFTDLTVTGIGSLQYFNYHDAFFPDGTLIDQTYRDVRSASAGGTVKYDLRNGIGLIVSGTYSDEHYPHRELNPGVLGAPASYSDLDRDSHGVNISGGITLELTHLIFGTVQVGYLNQSYVDPRLSGFSGLSYNADVLWNVTPLTSLRFTAARTVQDTSSPFIAGNTVSSVHVYADHELYRYVILSGDIGYDHFEPNGIGIGGDDYTASIGARYLINRRYTLSGNIRYQGRSSDSEFLRYQAVIGTVAFRVAF